MSDQFYFRQLLAGRDFASGDPLARSMRNFVYALGDRSTGEAVLVDPAYDPAQLVALVQGDGMHVTSVIATHFHPDHVGGTLMGAQHIAGVAELRTIIDVLMHVQREEVEWVKARSGLGDDALIAHHDGDRLSVGAFEVTLMHTPGHTPGSQCLLVEGRLLSGDTLFLDGCGRTDFPGGDAHEMYNTLHERLAIVSDDTVLHPGHLYSEESSMPMGEVRRRNYVLAPQSQAQWLAMFGS